MKEILCKTDSKSPCRRALLIGINDYPYFSPNSQLQGCIHDVELMTEVLAGTFSFRLIHQLTNGEATQQGIRSALETLRKEVDTDDIVVVYYSGHGSQLIDDEGIYETLVPCDSGRGEHENCDILDVEIAEWLHELNRRTPYVTLIFDSCHSGSITRHPLGARIRGVDRDDRRLVQRGRGGPLERGGLRWLPPSERQVLIAACGHNEAACELKHGEAGRPQGALTFHLCQGLSSYRGGESYLDLFEGFASRITAAYPYQHPLLAGAVDRELFGIRSFEPMRFVAVQERSAEQVTLAAGLAHGLTAGSQWAVHAPGTRRANVDTRLGRLLVLDDVQSTTARARILEEDGDAIRAGCRAVEESHDHGEMRWPVEIGADSGDASLCEALERRLRQSPFLRPGSSLEPERARIHLFPPRRKVRKGDPLPHAGPLKKRSWIVVDPATGGLLLPPHPVNESLEELVADLERRARHAMVLDLTNQDPESELRGLVDLEVLHQIGTEWQPADSDAVFEEGDRLAFRVTNRSEWVIHVALLDLGITRSVSVLFPLPSSLDVLAPGDSLETGLRPGDDIEVFLPESPSPDEGFEHVKLFATTQKADFRSLTQAGIRGSGEPLEKLLRKALTGYGQRSGGGVSTSDWTTVSRRFRVRRRCSPPDAA